MFGIRARSKQYAFQYRRFYSYYPNAGFGHMFSEWARNPQAKYNRSYGNGAAMRVMPIAYAFPEWNQMMRQVEASCLPTHNNGEAKSAAYAVAAAVRMAQAGETKDEIKEYIEDRFYDLSKSLEQIRKAVNAEMASYEEQLKSIAAIRAQTGTVTSYELAQIKKIYHKIATRIHPDINPQLFGNEEVKELWENVTSAYRSNDLDRMKELEAVASTVIAKYCGDVVAVVIGDLDEKIEEIKAQIAEIKSTDPYQYKYLLEDEESCAETEKNLKSEIEEYQEYLDYLNSQMEALGIS